MFVSTSGSNAAPAGNHILVLCGQRARGLMLLLSVWHPPFCTMVHALVFVMNCLASPGGDTQYVQECIDCVRGFCLWMLACFVKVTESYRELWASSNAACTFQTTNND